MGLVKYQLLPLLLLCWLLWAMSGAVLCVSCAGRLEHLSWESQGRRSC